MAWFTPTLVKTHLDGELLDWGERPCAFGPVASDDMEVRALDGTTKRIWRIEKGWRWAAKGRSPDRLLRAARATASPMPAVRH